MYTRSRNSQGYGNARGQPVNPNSTPGYQNSTYSAQGNFQPTQPMLGQNQQGNYKSNPVLNAPPFKPATPILQQQQQQQQQQQPMRTLQGSQPTKTQQSLKPPAQPQQQQLTTTPQTPRLKPILKQSSTATPVVTSVTAATNAAPVVQAPTAAPPQTIVSDVSIEAGNESMEVDNQEQPKWKRARATGYKVNKKLKRLRMNQRLRRALQPKNAIMVLNEMKTGIQFTFPETQADTPNSLFVVHAEIEGKTYVGQGLSKPLARQNAAENALKFLLLEKMMTATGKAQIDAESDGQSNQIDSTQAAAAAATAAASVVKEENSEMPGLPSEMVTEEQDEVPWSSLASFALYKLFVEWQNQGTVVPVSRPGVSPGRVKKEPKAPVQKDLPANAINIHPVMLLNQMKPGLTYVEVNRIGNPPNTMFTLGVEIDGVDYNGSAKNKKDAKKIAAKTALTALYGLVYPEETKMDHTEDIMMC